MVTGLLVGALVIAVRPAHLSSHQLPNNPLATSWGIALTRTQLHVFRIAAADFIGIMGLALFVFNWNIVDVLGFTGVAAVVLLLTVPRKEDWTRPAGKLAA